jgi:hypothetical protein
MPRKLVRVTANGGNGAAAATPPSPLRARLGEAVRSLREAQDQLGRLQTGRDKSREIGWGLSGEVSDLEAELHTTEADEPARRAYQFIAGDTVTAAVSPLTGLQERLAAKRKAYDDNRALEAALDAEIQTGLRAVPQLERQVSAALAEIIMVSPATSSLIAAHREAWAKLRSLRSALSVLASQVMIHAPSGTTEKWLSTQPIEAGVRLIATEDSFPTDLSLAEGLQQALSNLVADPEHAPDLPADI